MFQNLIKLCEERPDVVIRIFVPGPNIKDGCFDALCNDDSLPNLDWTMNTRHHELICDDTGSYITFDTIGDAKFWSSGMRADLTYIHWACNTAAVTDAIRDLKVKNALWFTCLVKGPSFGFKVTRPVK